MEKRYGFTMEQGLIGAHQQGMAQGAMQQAARGMQGQWFVVPDPPKVVERTVLPSVEMLARALFQTDDEVIRFLSDVGDAVAPVMPPNTDWGRVGDLVMAKAERAEQIAWDRDERGWRTRATHRAERVLIHLEDAGLPNGSATGDASKEGT